MITPHFIIQVCLNPEGNFLKNSKGMSFTRAFKACSGIVNFGERGSFISKPIIIESGKKNFDFKQTSSLQKK